MPASPAKISMPTPAEAPHGKFVYLLTAQVVMLVAAPYLDRPGWPMLLFRLIGVLAFTSAIYAVSAARKNWILALALALPALALNSIFAFSSAPRLVVPTLLCSIAFLVFTLVSLLHAVVTARRVSSDTIYGAISVYLLMGLTWGSVFLLVVRLQPSALSSLRHPSQTLDWGDCVFYSYVTLTSLGYGDIVPMTPHARSLSILEAVTGIMYVAVLVARLVGLYSIPRQQGS